MSNYTFPCGCSFPINDEISPDVPSIIFSPSLKDINMECERTWDLISAGNTKGVFQLESQLGQSLARKLKPRNINHLAALISIVRPGCLEAIHDKKSVTMHYIDRKNGLDDVNYFHPALETSLKDTYGEMIYQEQAMQISKDIAGFTMQEADELRKAIGKKKPELMAKIKTKFIEGCNKTKIVTEEEAKQIFDWIEKSQRYSFNKCLTPDTIVETLNGYKTLEDIQVGDKVKAPDETYTKEEYVEVINKYDNGLQEVYEIELENGDKIKCTLEHKFLANDGKIYPLYEILHNNLQIMVYN